MVVAEMKHVSLNDAEKVQNMLSKPGNETLNAAVVQSRSRSEAPVFKCSVNALHQCILRTLSKTDLTPKNFKEASDQRLLHLVMSRTVSHVFPLDTLVVLDPSWRAVLQRLSEKTTKNELLALNDSQKKLVKFAVLLYDRMCSLLLQYQKPLVNPAAGSADVAKSTVVVCGFCYELLTYFGTGKRPPSFGWFLDTERMEHRCYRDDSDRLHLVRLADPRTGTRLSVRMPERPAASACVRCFELIHADRQLCTSCQPKEAHVRSESAMPDIKTKERDEEKVKMKEQRKRSAFLRSLHYEQDMLALRRLIR